MLAVLCLLAIVTVLSNPVPVFIWSNYQIELDVSNAQEDNVSLLSGDLVSVPLIAALVDSSDVLFVLSAPMISAERILTLAGVYSQDGNDVVAPLKEFSTIMKTAPNSQVFSNVNPEGILDTLMDLRKETVGNTFGSESGLIVITNVKADASLLTDFVLPSRIACGDRKCGFIITGEHFEARPMTLSLSGKSNKFNSLDTDTSNSVSAGYQVVY